MEQKDSLSSRVISSRQKKNWSLGELAKETGLSKQALSFLESGRTTNPGIDTIKLVAEALGVSITWLAYGEEDGE